MTRNLKKLPLQAALTIALAVAPLTALTQTAAAATDSAALQKSRDQALSYMHAELAKNDFKYVNDWPALSIYAAGQSPTAPEWTTADGKNGPLWRQAELARGANITAALTDFESTLIGALASGQNPRAFGRKDLVEAVLTAQTESGKFADTVYGLGEDLLNAHIYGIISVYVAGLPLPRHAKAGNYLFSKQHADGGFNWSNASDLTVPSDPDVTAMALLAMKALQVPQSDEHVQHALHFLQNIENDHGGFSSVGAENSDTAATVIEALVAWNIDPASWKKGSSDPLSELLSYQLANGAFAHTKGGSASLMSTQNAVLALSDLMQGSTAYDRLHDKDASLAPEWRPVFTDMSASQPYYAQVMRMANLGIMAGDPSGTFGPEDGLTREQFAKILVYALDYKDEVGPVITKFRDVSRGSWSNGFIQVAEKHKLILGTSDNTFEPVGQVTGAQLMAILVRGLGLDAQGKPLPGQQNWYDRYVQVAKDQGLWYPSFNPTEFVSRAEVCYSLDRFYQAEWKQAQTQQ